MNKNEKRNHSYCYQYGAIDSIVQTNKRKYKSFTDFMIKYSKADRELCEMIHSTIRSADWHAGHLPLCEMHYATDLIYDTSHIQLLFAEMESHKLMRTAILNWLDEQTGLSPSN